VIVYINNRCNQWADWCTRRKVGGLGFPRECCYTRLEARGGNGNSSLIDEAAWEIHQAVGDLPPVLQTAVMVFYLGKGTVDQKARDCLCARRTLFDRIQMAHVRIMDWLNAEAAGLPHAKPDVKRTCIARTVSV
jgi:hypothetical protein